MEKLNLNIEKPIVFIKLHTTGLNPKLDRIVQITISKFHPDGTSKTGTRLVNPEIPIPEEATNVNGITNEMVDGKPTFYQIANSLHQFIGDSDIVGFNIKNFDLKFLMEEFFKAQLDFNCAERNVIDLQEIYHTLQPRDFVAAAREFAGVELMRGAPISSDSYSQTCVSILNGFVKDFKGKQIQLQDGEQVTFSDTPVSINEAFGKGSANVDMKGYITKNEAGKLVFNYGKKWKGEFVAKMISDDMSYVTWLMSQDAIPRDTKSILTTCINKMNAETVAQNG